MSRVRVIVVRSAGINCDQEAVHAWRLAGADVDLIHINRLIKEPNLLDSAQIFTVPGGFSYGDDIAAGRILAMQLTRNLSHELRVFVDRGKMILGICNGFQVLVRAGLLPGAGESGPRVSLAQNASGKFEDRWIQMEACTDRCPLLEKGERFHVPVAHAEGRLIVESEESLNVLRKSDHVALRYVNSAGPTLDYPANPNGSHDAIAGLIDPTGRILGFMPHPERHVDRYQHPYWTRSAAAKENEAGEGLRIFQRGVQTFR